MSVYNFTEFVDEGSAACQKRCAMFATVKKNFIAEFRTLVIDVGKLVVEHDLKKEFAKTELRNAFARNSHHAATNIKQALVDKTIDDGLAEGMRQQCSGGNDRDIGKVASKADGILAEPDWRERKINGKPSPSMHNARLAIIALGVTCSLDTFHNKVLFGYRDETFKHQLQSFVGEVSDRGIMALRQLASDRFGFDLNDEHMRDAVQSLALENCFNPVCDLIDKAEAEWDGVKRLDRMAVDYFNCEDTPLNRACIRKTMIAMIARARMPGIKFDTITVLESPEGFNKSTAWRILAGDENFSDEAIIGKDSREVQEQLAGVWIHESADLAGMKKSEVETVKTYASRQTDRARPAFGHFSREAAAPLDRSRHHQQRRIPAVPDRQPALLAAQGHQVHRYRETAPRPAPADRRSRKIPIRRRKYRARRGAVAAAARIEQEQRRVKDPWEALLATMPELSRT